MNRRKRISKNTVADLTEFKANCASENARLLHKYNEFEVELWIDKHYHDRRIHGDDSGKREGIEELSVQDLIIKSFKYLIDFYLRGQRFNFINYFDVGKTASKERIVLKNYLSNKVLNVVIEIHYLDTSKYEVTVITAMVVDDFKVSDGQYVFSFTNNLAKLNRMVNKSIQNIYSCNL